MMEQYDHDYYENGISTGKSLYENYRWLPSQTLQLAQDYINLADIQKEHVILDYGCAKGYFVKALGMLEYDAYGWDPSPYAQESFNDDPEIFNRTLLNDPSSCEFRYDHIWCKDVLEHIPYASIDGVIANLYQLLKYNGALTVIVPLADNGKYIIPDNERDVTHIIRENENWWFDHLAKTFDIVLSLPDDIIREFKRKVTDEYPGGVGMFVAYKNPGFSKLVKRIIGETK